MWKIRLKTLLHHTSKGEVILYFTLMWNQALWNDDLPYQYEYIICTILACCCVTKFFDFRDGVNILDYIGILYSHFELLLVAWWGRSVGNGHGTLPDVAVVSNLGGAGKNGESKEQICKFYTKIIKHTWNCFRVTFFFRERNGSCTATLPHHRLCHCISNS